MVMTSRRCSSSPGPRTRPVATTRKSFANAVSGIRDIQIRVMCAPGPILGKKYWLGDLDSNQGRAGQSREFYR